MTTVGWEFSFPDLPIVPLLPRLATLLAHQPAAILTAPPGSGKTTLVPLALLAAPWLQGKTILMLEPRRLAARAAAARMAELCGEAVGERVGYQIRFERRVSRTTRIEILTEGILTRRLQSDPELAGVGLVIFDEFHERSLQADLGLALCLDLRALRADLRLLVMSATLETTTLSRLLGDAPVLTGAGRQHPVTIHHLDRDPQGPLTATVANAVRQAAAAGGGDILAFLPGAREIRATASALATSRPDGMVIQPLYGDLSGPDQDRVIRPRSGGPRRVILATDIAETSLTIPGIAIVVDGGYCRRPAFHPASGLTRLETVRISKASADQRAGRAGRLGPGDCYRLWTPAAQAGLPTATSPEIVEADLAPLLLELALWGVPRVEGLAWLDPPPPAAVDQARDLLQTLGALDRNGRLTATGRAMARLPVHPRLAHMILSAATPGERSLACDLAAILGERDPLRTSRGDRSADLTERLHLLELFRRQGAAAVARLGGDGAACGRIVRAARQIRRLARVDDVPGAPVDGCGILLAAAFPDRVARRRPGRRGRYLLAGGRGALLDENDPLGNHPLLVAAELDAGRTEGRIFLAAELTLEDLRERCAQQIRQEDEVVWDRSQARVVARRVERFGSLELGESPLPSPPADRVRSALLEGIVETGPGMLDWSRGARSLQARVALLRRLRPHEGWPDLSDAALIASLADWLEPWLDGITRREQVQRLDLATILRQRLDWGDRQRLDEGAPTHLLVPSGSRLPLDYTAGEAPVLAVRIQEMFGQTSTPTVGWGAVPVLLHLLSPARRPVQVTRDLHSFWTNTWSTVRKELAGRYPKHHWPEDPSQAQATARVKRSRKLPT
ncbi:MAG: ATP-dependent helicase HrpB [Magnetococcales bacterium]|nr:ATP-dependent helicase HrpB [Magnetococcales bacterium]